MGDSRRNALVLSALLALIQVLGCAAMAPRQLEYETGDEASTKDGLRRVRTTRGATYVRPGTSLSSYQKVAIGPSTTTYRAASQRKTNEQNRNTGHDNETTARINEILRESLERELLQSSRFTVVTGRGPNILWIRGHVVDLDIDFSPSPHEERRMGGRLGEVTLALDVRDPQTGEARVRLLERRELTASSSARSTSSNVAVNAWKAIEESFSEWAYQMRIELEGLADVEMPPAPAQ